MIDPKITVIIPSYNSAHWVTQAIESALAQTLPPVQIIVVDDGSKDDTADRVGAYRDRGVEYVYQANAGVLAARNNGISRAKGDHVAFLDADDYWHPRKLELQAVAMAQRPGVAMLGTWVFDWPGKLPDEKITESFAIREIGVNMLVIRNILTTSSILVRKSVLDEMGDGPFDRRLQGPEDYDLWLRIAERFRVAELRLPLTGYRDHLDGLGNQPKSMRPGLLRILDKLEERGVWDQVGRNVRRQSFAFFHYNCARMYMASGEHITAIKEVLLSIRHSPLPMPREYTPVAWVRYRFLGVLILQELGLKTSLRGSAGRAGLKTPMSSYVFDRPDTAVADSALAASPAGAFLGMAFLSLQPIVLSAIALPATLLVIRRLGESEYGQWATATTICATVAILTNLGLRGTFVREIAKHPDRAEDLLGHQLALRTILALSAGLLGLLACFVLRYTWTTIECMGIAAMGLILNTFSATASDLLQAMQKFKTVATLYMAAGLVLTAASVAAVLFGGGAAAVALGYLAGPVVAVVASYLIISRNLFQVRLKWDLRVMRRMLGESKFIGVQQFLNPMNQNVEALLMPRMIGEAPFGFFSAGSLLASRLTAIPDGIGTVAYPVIAQKHEISGRAAVRSTLYFAGLVFIISVFAALTISLLAGPLSRILFPGRAATCEQVMRITIWLLPLMGLHCITCYALNAVHADASQAKASLIGTVLSVTLGAFLVWRFGVIGAAWSMVARYLIQLVALIPCVMETGKRLMGPPPSPGEFETRIEPVAVANSV